MAASGSGANIKPDTIPSFFKKVTMARKDALAISVIRNKKTYTWTWN